MYFIGTIHSQNTITGIVTDAEGNLLSDATVLIKDKTSLATLNYTTTNDKGVFLLSTKGKRESVLIKISFFGFSPYKTIQELDDKTTDIGTIVLQRSISQLEDVVIKAEKRVIIKGDTTIYKTAKFLKGNEENLEDILKRVPYLDVNADGKITVNGKTIDRLLIDGDDIYKNQHQLATSNLPSDIIGDLEVINNYRDFESLNKNKETGLTALNVTIKEDAKGTIKGNVEAGSGVVNAYKVNPTLLLFKKKNKFSIISKFNNIGISPLSIRDYFDLTSPATISPNSTSSKVIFSTLDEVPNFLKAGDNATSRTINFFTLSHVFKNNKTFKVDTYVLFNSSKQIENNAVNTIVTNAEGVPRVIDESIDANETNYFGTLQTKAILKPNENTVTTLKSNLTIDISDQQNTLISENLEENSVINQTFTPNRLNSNTNLSFNKKLTNAAFVASGYLDLLKFSKSTSVNSNNPFLGFDFANNAFKLEQDIENNKTDVGLALNYTYDIGKTSLGLFSKTSQLNETFISTNESSSIENNNAKLNSFRNYNGVDFYIPFGKKISFTINAGYVLNTYNLNNTFFENDYFQGNILSRYVFNGNNIAELSYDYSNNFTTLDNVLNNPFVIDYRNIQTNNNLSINTFVPKNQFSFKYFKFNPGKESSIIFNSRYSFTNKTINTSNSNNEALTNRVLSLNGEEKNVYTSLFYKQKLGFLPLSFVKSVSYDYKQNLFFENELENTLEISKLSGFLSFDSNFKKTTLLINFGVSYSLEKFADNNISTNQNIYQYFFTTSYELLKNFNTSLNTTITDYITNNNLRTIYFLSPVLRYSIPKSNWEFKLIGNNLLNIDNNEIVNSTAQQNYSEQRVTSILNGFIVLTAKYKF